MKRGIFDVILFLSLFIFPWWIGAILALVGIFIFKNFYEFILSALIIYSLYFIQGNSLIASPFYFFTIIIIIYFGIQILRNRIILYDVIS